MTTQDAADRARNALIEMIDRGETPTARSVRQHSGVAMQVAADVVAHWRREEADQPQAPAIPEAVQTRFGAIWRDLYAAADAIHRPAREAADQRADAITAERDALLGDVAELETQLATITAERDKALAQVDETNREISLMQARLEEQRRHADQTTERAATQDRTIGQLQAQIAELQRETTPTKKPATRKQTRPS